MKSCFKCGELKPFSDLYRHSRMADGYLGKCKSCAKRDVHENRQSKFLQYREYERKRYSESAERRESCSRHASDWSARNPDKRLAHRAVQAAVESGALIPGPCESCSAESPIHAHHDDYSKPLDIRWLCISCHRRHHASVKT